MEKKILCLMAGYESQLEEKIQSYRDVLLLNHLVGRQTPDLPHHITLGSFDLNDEFELIGKMEKASNLKHKFPITLSHLGIFPHTNVLFIGVDENEQLIELQRHFIQMESWTPHTTMLIDDPTKLMEAIELLMPFFKPLKGDVSSLHLYEFFPKKHIKTVYLK